MSFSMDSLSPLPQYCAANILVPAEIPNRKRFSTKVTCAASETADIES